MESKESDNRNREELFEMLKGKCKSRAKRTICLWLIFLIIAIAIFFFFGQRIDVKEISFMPWAVIGIGVGWFILYAYRFLKRLDDIDTPERLLREFDKNSRNTRLGGIVMWIVLTCTCFIIALVKSDVYSWTSAIGIAFSGLIVYLMDKSNLDGQVRRAKERDEEFREQLRELTREEEEM